jgi:peptidoglycan/LPS O-acetylase OafA/YrhL
VKWRNWLNAVMGVWLALSPWVLGISNQRYATRASIIVGLILVLVSIWGAMSDNAVRNNGLTAVAFSCGLWFVAVQAFLGHYEIGQFWAVVAPGLLTMALTLWTWMERTRFADPGGGGH